MRTEQEMESPCNALISIVSSFLQTQSCNDLWDERTVNVNNAAVVYSCTVCYINVYSSAVLYSYSKVKLTAACE